ncbi:hypothetical protein [Silvimonas iriomotensis]|uniref:Uncharacterized protein n=1 Tax=Silvimonas iriomotensis TaxID=449662 RepID=A0ABQ2PFB9_9NEIS|nr:hypothetical protein [Silvimonas iriomotensis]GGP23965.1 hypothetical protein GCM10010970_39650 [Silvimonas iriomotensis]
MSVNPPSDGFPNDDKYYFIRWIDRIFVPQANTSTAGINILLEELPSHWRELHDNAYLQVFKKRAANYRVCRCLVGELPRYFIGVVIHKQKPVGQLNLKERPFDLSADNWEMKILPSNSVLSKSRDGGFSPRLLQQYEYCLYGQYEDAGSNFLTSNILTFRSGSKIILIPAITAFTGFYAHHSEIAKALLTGPWEGTKNLLASFSPEDIVQLPKTRVLDNGQWQIILRRSMQSIYGPLLAHLMLDEVGYREASYIYKSVLATKAADRGDGALISVGLPFVFTRFKLQAVAVDLSEDKVLITHIRGFSWPETNPVVVVGRDNDAQAGDKVTATNDPPPYIPQMVSESEAEEVSMTAQQDASLQRGNIEFVVPAVDWLNKPEKTRYQKHISKSYSRTAGQHRGPVLPPPELASAGGKAGGGNNIAGADSATILEKKTPDNSSTTVTRDGVFDDVVRCLGRAVTAWALINKAGDITKDRSVSGECYHWVAFWDRVDDLLIDVAMVARLTSTDTGGKQTQGYLLEINSARPLRGLLFCPGSMTLKKAISELISYARAHKGIWPEHPPEKLRGLSYYAPFKHYYDHKRKTADGASPLKTSTYSKPMQDLTDWNWRHRKG